MCVILTFFLSRSSLDSGHEKLFLCVSVSGGARLYLRFCFLPDCAWTTQRTSIDTVGSECFLGFFTSSRVENDTVRRKGGRCRT